jgi:hypothetical protein
MMTPIACRVTEPHAILPRQANLARGVIVGSALLVLALLAWVHLGLGALLFPPAPDPARQLASPGPYQVTMLADSGELLVGDHNTISLLVSDAAHHAIISGASVTVSAEMLTMPMPVPAVPAIWSHDRYSAHPIFSMAGPWQLTVTIRAPGQPGVHATFRVGVRWHA